MVAGSIRNQDITVIVYGDFIGGGPEGGPAKGEYGICAGSELLNYSLRSGCAAGIHHVEIAHGIQSYAMGCGQSGGERGEIYRGCCAKAIDLNDAIVGVVRDIKIFGGAHDGARGI
jgi:hypothetical protein